MDLPTGRRRRLILVSVMCSALFNGVLTIIISAAAFAGDRVYGFLARDVSTAILVGGAVSFIVTSRRRAGGCLVVFAAMLAPLMGEILVGLPFYILGVYFGSNAFFWVLYQAIIVIIGVAVGLLMVFLPSALTKRIRRRFS